MRKQANAGNGTGNFAGSREINYPQTAFDYPQLPASLRRVRVVVR